MIIYGDGDKPYVLYGIISDILECNAYTFANGSDIKDYYSFEDRIPNDAYNENIYVVFFSDTEQTRSYVLKVLNRACCQYLQRFGI